MNRHAYRLVFNSHRGALVAVAENVSSRSKAQAATCKSGHAASSNMLLAQLGVLVACLFGGVTFSISAAQAQITAAANAAQHPIIDQSANGLPVIQIVTPNGAGLSHNRYEQFNVGQQGAILNNAQNVTQTQQAGYIAGNGALAGGSARLILNEVTSANPSSLRGYLEVAGQRAEVIIANPNGITCSGCGFINTSRSVLSTGTPEFSADGRLANLRVRQGDISIGSMNAAAIDQVDLIARSVQVNGELWANQLNVISGANLVDYANLGVQVIAGQGAQLTVTIDLAQLGGMYANKIRLVGTEAGIGVRSLGDIAAQAGDIQIDSSGKLTLAGSTSASGNISIADGDDIDNHGQLYAGQALQVRTSGGLDNDGIIAAQADVHLQAHDIANHNAIAAGVDATGNATGSGTLQLNADNSIDNRNGKLYGKDDLLLHSGGALNNGHGQIGSHGTHASLTLAAADIDNRNGDIINQGSGESSLSATDGLTNTATLSSVGNLRVSAGQLDNSGLINSSANTIIRATELRNLGRIYGDNVALGAGTLRNEVNPANNDASVIAARRTLHIGAGTITNREHALLQSLGDMHIGGSLDSDDQTSGSAEHILNASATIDAGGDLQLHTAELINRNDHFSTIEEIDPALTRHVTEYADWTQPDVWYRADEVRWSDSGNGGIVLVRPDGNRFEKFYKRDYTEIVLHTVVQSSDPGRISAGGSLSGTLEQLTNIGAAGTATTIHQMTAGQNYYHWVSGESHANYYQYDHGSAAYDNIMPSTGIELAIASVSPHTASERIDNEDLHGALPEPPLPSFKLPNNDLFILHPQPGQAYLVETDPRFTHYQTFLSSDYLLNRLGLDPQQLQKRLGDGYYEQKIITDQLIELTGKRLLGGYASAEDQFRALMEAGIASAKAFQLTPGLALSAAQIAALTADLVWLVEQDVALPDGSNASVLVPVVYLSRISSRELTPSGTLIAAQDIQLSVNGSLNNGGTLLADKQLIVQATDINNSGDIRSNAIDGDVLLAASNDLVSHGSIRGNRVGILAGNDITLASTTASHTGANGLTTRLDQLSSIDAGQLSIQAGRDVKLEASSIQSSGDASIAAGRDLNLTTVTTQATDNVSYNKDNHLYQSRTQVIGSGIDTGGALTLSAGQDINTQAAYANAAGALTAVAGRDVNLGVAQQESTLDQAIYTTSTGPFNSSVSASTSTTETRTTIGSTLSADSVRIQAGNNMTVTGSNVVATQDVALLANNIRIATAHNSATQQSTSHESTSGLMSSGFGLTIGDRGQDRDTQTSLISNVGSTIGSVGGNVLLSAAAHYTQTGSDILSPVGDITIAAKHVDINAAYDSSSMTDKQSMHQSGLTLALTAPVLSALQTVRQMSTASKQTDDSRMQAMAAAAAANAIKDGYDSASSMAQDPQNLSGHKITLSVGTSQSETTTTQSAMQAKGSHLAAGGNLNITAIGSTLSGAGNVNLIADNAIPLLAAQSTNSQTSDNQSSGASLGVGFALGGSQNGFTLEAGVSIARGNADGSDMRNNNTSVHAGNMATLVSGSDTQIKGASVSGNGVVANVGGDLHIKSLQDTSTFDSKQSSAGLNVSICVPPFCYGSSSASGNLAHAKVNGDFASVTEQSCINAGDGGFNITVGGNTDLKGAVIASTQQAIANNKNSLSTATLTHSAIENHDTYDASGFSLSASVAGKAGDQSSGTAHQHRMTAPICPSRSNKPWVPPWPPLPAYWPAVGLARLWRLMRMSTIVNFMKTTKPKRKRWPSNWPTRAMGNLRLSRLRMRCVQQTMTLLRNRRRTVRSFLMMPMRLCMSTTVTE